jgi:hypothetical protein
MSAGSWTLVEELFAAGSEKFVTELRQTHIAERLGEFAKNWYSDTRPFARQSLFDYLSLPLNCYRHEPLVKRLFKLAEKASDDEVMGAFLVCFDRVIRRQRRTRNRTKYEQFQNQAAADTACLLWEAEGYKKAGSWTSGGRVTLFCTKTEEVVVMPGNTRMPRPKERDLKKNMPIDDGFRKWLEKKFILFSMPTRRYLRRRAWRYFRKIGKTDPERYIRAAVGFLSRYTDTDTDSDIHLLDNWGLIHALFRHSPALVCPANGWDFAAGKTLADFAPAPRFEAAWIERPAALFDVLMGARCRSVRQWAMWMLRRHNTEWLESRPVTTFLRLADHDDPELSAFGFELLEKAADLASVPVDEWLSRLGGDDLAKLQRLSDLLVRRLDPNRVATSDVLRLAGYRSKPVAELGMGLLKQRSFSSGDASVLLPLVQAECESVRPSIVLWLRETLAGFGAVRYEWVLEFLDSKHADVRAIGWEWLNTSNLKDDPVIWHRLIESPYDDIRGPLVASLAQRESGADADAVRLLWASVLLNVTRGGRYKPGVVERVVARLARHPVEADRLVPLLAVAVRSLRGPEFRAGLMGLIRLIETQPELIPTIRERFPELIF